MTTFNRDGCVLMAPDGRLIHDSAVSVYSGKRVSPGGVLEAVPGVPGLYVRLLPREARQLDGAARAVVYDRAKAWHARMTAETNETSHPGMPPDDPADLDTLTVEQLREQARAVGLTGTSKLTRAALLAALRAQEDGPDDGAPDEGGPGDGAPDDDTPDNGAPGEDHP